ncbi:MAG: hypothetical protein Fur002_01240 [Anaerolineales bacterium]
MMRLFPRLWFNLRYLGKAPWDSGITPPELWDFIRAHPAGCAIDFGCGTGTNAIALAQAGWQVIGVDFSARAIQLAKQKEKRAGVSVDFRVGDVTRLNLNAQFDLALDIGCFHGVLEKEKYLDQLEKILAPNGFWLVYGFFKQSAQRGDPGLTPDDLSRISARSFSLVTRADGFDRRARPSMWALYQREVKTQSS